MIKALLALGVAAVALAAAPSEAQHYSNYTQCTQWRHGECVSGHRLTRAEARRRGYAVGYRFGPGYNYVDVDTLPQPVVMHYHLGPHFRYVTENGYVYVVNPRTYRVVRVINEPM